MSLFPDPPKNVDPRTWPEMLLYVGTVLLEAEGEPDEGKVAVAWVIRNRMDAEAKTVAGVCLAPMQFSAWNDDYAGMRKARLTAPDPKMWERCWRAACGAFWRLLPDPTAAADHYLNVELTRESRKDGSLPAWFDPAKVTARIGHHTFLRLG